MAEDDLDGLRRVFAYHVLREVVAADGTIDEAEQAFLDARFPPDALRTEGLVDSAGEPTVRLTEQFAHAVPQLRVHLSREDKLSLVDTFLQASLADGQLHHAESGAVVRAAELLELPSSAWLARLDAQGLGGDIDLPEPEGLEGALQLIDDPSGPTVTPADAATQTPDDAETETPTDA